MRHLGLIVALALAACSSSAPTTTGNPYLDDASFRRRELEASLVNPSNGYGALRLAHYDSGADGDWSRLPRSNPNVAPLGLDGNPVGELAALDLASSSLGEDAFFRYPVEEIPDSYATERVGFWNDATHGLGGLVHVRYDNGFEVTAMTCSTCHARSVAGKLVVGLGNAELDLGLGPGRLDVTTSDGSEPVQISDLRPVKLLTYLHHDANVKQNDETTLAIRIETLITTNHAQESRPPREVSLALAKYVWSLADTLPPIPPSNDGAAVFSANCARCHDPASGFTGAPVALAEVGTDPKLGLSSERGTGT
ncbi:MAG TPA: hypothetical protein VF407_05130, partial [Polyangiaceae bacterium]